MTLRSAAQEDAPTIVLSGAAEDIRAALSGSESAYRLMADKRLVLRGDLAYASRLAVELGLVARGF